MDRPGSLDALGVVHLTRPSPAGESRQRCSRPCARHCSMFPCHLRCSGTHHMCIADIARKPTATTPSLARIGSANAALTIERMNGSTAMTDQYGTPTFFPQALHVVGLAGPRQNLRIRETPGSSQYGHSYIFFIFRIERVAVHQPREAWSACNGWLESSLTKS
jgi:hypothetical protein